MPQQQPSLEETLLLADIASADAVIHALECAAALYAEHTSRHGSTIHLNAPDHITITGDLHDHGPNLLAAARVANPDEQAGRHVVFQEVIHGPRFVNGCDLSIRTLARLAHAKMHFPTTLHHILSNHELAQINGEGILKNGKNTIEAFDEGISFAFPNEAKRIRQALTLYVQSLPLAICTSNRILIAHSVPSPRHLEKFDPRVLHRNLQPSDLMRGSDAHKMVWGRNQDNATLDALAAAWDVDWFVLGHQPAEMGFEPLGNRALILNTDHEHAAVLTLDLSENHTLESLEQACLPLAAIA